MPSAELRGGKVNKAMSNPGLDARAVAEAILTALQEVRDRDFASWSDALESEQNADPGDQESARRLVEYAHGVSNGSYWAWYAAHRVYGDYFGDWTMNPTDVMP